MTQFVIANNVNTQLAAAASSGATTLTLASSTNLPTLSAGQIMPLTLNDAATGQNYEIVYVTAISGVTLTVTRAQEGTGALNWSIGDYAYCAPTAGTVAMTSGNPNDTFQVAASTALTHAPQTGQVQRSAFNYAGLAGGTANALTATLSPAPASYTDYLNVTVRIAATNTGSASLNVNGLGVVPIIGLGHQTLQGGELFAGGFATFAYSTNYSEAILLECTGGALQIAPGTASEHAAQLQQIGHGQCRLSVTNTTTLTLNPFNGNNIIIGGVPRQVPNGGVTVSNAGTNPNTLYYVYVSWGGGGNIVLSLSTTGHSTSSTGIETMTGNTSYTLVGMVYMNGSAQFIDTATTRTCLNWFNRRNLNVNFISLTSYNFTSTTFAEVTSALRLGLITWGDECVTGGIDGEMSNNTASQSVSVYSAIDGAQVGPACGVFESSANGGQAYSSHSAQFLSEGYHTPSIYGEVTGGTGTLQTAGIGYIIRG